jgi:spore coat polysaccharide biosynthesis protein SpsF
MTSTRLPGKVLRSLAGKPMLAQQLGRLKACREVDEIIVATTTNASDDPVSELAQKEGVGCFRGDEHDVLKRYVGAACESGADVVVRITADCPLIDAGVTDDVIRALTQRPGGADYAGNVLQRTYPRGLDTEAFYLDTLLRVHRLASSKDAREHVTVYIRSEHPELFLAVSVTDSENNSDLRWTVDTELDFQVVGRMYEDLNLATQVLSYREMLAYARSHPELFQKNKHLDAGYRL